MTNLNGYVQQGRRFLDQAFAELTQDDLRQASEKGWGAAAQLVKAYADHRGFAHNSHALLYSVVSRLAAETQDTTYRTLFHEAGGLHENFYEGQYTAEDVRDLLDKVSQFVDRVSDLVNAE